MAAQNVNINKSDIKNIIYENKLPLSLENCKIKITYKILSDIFSVINDVENPLSPQDVLIPCLNLLCGWDVTDVVGRPSNFLRNKLNKINNKKKPICLDDPVPEFFSNSLLDDCSFSESVMVASNFLGNYCEKLKINKNLLNIILDENEVNMPKVVLTNGALLEIEAFRQKRI